jgi:hypothetical protein
MSDSLPAFSAHSAVFLCDLCDLRFVFAQVGVCPTLCQPSPRTPRSFLRALSDLRFVFAEVSAGFIHHLNHLASRILFLTPAGNVSQAVRNTNRGARSRMLIR